MVRSLPQIATIALVLIVVAVAMSSAQISTSNSHRTAADATDDPAESGDLVNHGEYLVHHVAMCVECHSPRNNDGTLDEQQLLAGAPVPMKSPFAGRPWAFRAPALRGLPGGWTKAQLATFLQSGKPPTDHQIRPPMPPFRLTERDAHAVAEYLQSLDK